MPYKSPTISDLLLATLCSGRSVKRFHAIIREREFKRYKKESVRMTLSRLNKKGCLINSGDGWKATKKGKHRLTEIELFSYLSSPFEEKSPDKTIISFDIPELERRKRNWLRNQIKIFNYKMLQQSVWMGPGPLPKVFLEKLIKLEIRKNVKIFSITKKI